MKYEDLVTISLNEARELLAEVVLCEDGEGPRWKFDYSNFNNDPNPDILLLGAYRHPTTRNNLVGGINLNYLTQKQYTELAKELPKIMAAGSLYRRYHLGKRLLPDIFANCYRTYNAAYIRGVDTDVMYPKYGIMKTAKDWVKNKISSMFKSKDQRTQDAQPKYPQDLQQMRQELDDTVQRLQQAPAADPNSPEMQMANKEKQDAEYDNSTSGIERREDVPLVKAAKDLRRRQVPGLAPELPPDQIGPEIQADKSKEAAPPLAQQKASNRRDFEQERRENQQELMRPKAPDENKLLEPQIPAQPSQSAQQLPPQEELAPQEPISINTTDEELKESVITYYSPRLGRYITESVSLIHC
jgi:hypothetical protein